MNVNKYFQNPFAVVNNKLWLLKVVKVGSKQLLANTNLLTGDILMQNVQ